MNDEIKCWLEYIIKINDRQISRQQASGFTTWAILGILGVIFFKFLDKLTLFINNPENVSLLIIYFINIINLLLVTCFFIGDIGDMANKDYERRLLSRISLKTITIFELVFLIPVLLFSLINFYVAIYNTTLMAWSYYIFGIFMLFESLIYFIYRNRVPSNYHEHMSTATRPPDIAIHGIQ